MASELPSQKFLVKDLPTKSVTLYPSRAHVVREINEVNLEPGLNTIEIFGVTPTADEHSVQVDGRGSATIIDMTVGLVPNRDIYEEVYPEDSDSEPSDSDDEDSDENEIEAVKAISEAIKELHNIIRAATEEQTKATNSLTALDRYKDAIRPEHNSPEDVTKLLAMYDQKRTDLFTKHSEATDKLAKLNKDLERKKAEHWKAGKEERKRLEKLDKEKEKARMKRVRQLAERRKEAKRVKEERLKFWPKNIYRIVLTLETAGMDTPASSRRGSLDSVTIAQGYVPPKTADSEKHSATSISLSLSYVTREASWSPRYDLSISSINKSATIIYRAEFSNCTSETWKDARVALSTSQTSYSGLDDKVPWMHSWHLKLGKYGNAESEGLMSHEEQNRNRGGRAATNNVVNRKDLFGLNNSAQSQMEMLGVRTREMKKYNGRSMPPPPPAPGAAQSGGGGLFGSSATNSMPVASALFGGQPRQQIQQIQQIQQAQRSAQPHSEWSSFGPDQPVSEAAVPFQRSRNRAMASRAEVALADEDAEEEEDDDEEDLGFALDFQESTWEDSGLTTTYDVPGLRTLAPSSTARRHKIASLTASKIDLSHVAVPKLRPSAFLRARIRNPSSNITLLKGIAGVTLDGTFLGNMNMGRVSPGGTFELPLGVDPAIHISYPKPSVKRSTIGMFQKESAQTYVRNIWITNTKTVPVEVLVLDQVPISEDERLKIEIVTPRGLSKEGDRFRAGAAAKEGASATAVDGAKDAAWGRAVASLKKNGEVAWNVNLEKKGAGLLKLEYEARLPNAEKIVTA
ncbi:hypothetical protein K402DRAFT_392945 [Aulographum hederae CBS 113979]|uniref:DUF4139 domain-containing protein n=1 Tax=Aulographum hederae CBS 113979 TaxID=1176131 RepID=A0A6G1H202_9PEZI|nr:hypothetical protein K402DRAFT_392945 [Aulographum hederae CBS 113979]